MNQASQGTSLMSRYRAGGALRHVFNFTMGVLIGSTIVLFVWMNGRLIPITTPP